MNNRCFGKEISNDFGNQVYNMKNNILQIQKTINNIENANNKKTKGVNNIKKNFNGKENKPLNNNKVKNNENIPNNNNLLKYKNNEKKENLNKNILSIKNKLKSIKTEYRLNPLDEYDDLIMKNLFIDENNNRPDYKILNQTFNETDRNFRFNSINFIISLCETFELNQETIYLSINIFDRCYLKFKSFNNNNQFNNKEFVLSCIFIASKYEEIYPPLLEDYSEYCFFRNSEIFQLENFILDVINFELHICSPYLFLTKFFHSKPKKEAIEILYLSQLILDLSIISLEFCQLKPSLQASICLYLARYIYYKKIKGIILWTRDDEFMTGYSAVYIKNNTKPSLIKIREFYFGNLTPNIEKTGIFRKYCSDNYLRIAKSLKGF